MTEAEIQEKIAQAYKLITEAGDMADELGIEIDFMGCVFEPHVGWFSPDGELQAESDWNSSACVIDSAYAEGYGMAGWKARSPRKDWSHPNK